MSMKKITKGMLELVELSDKFRKQKKELPTVYERSDLTGDSVNNLWVKIRKLREHNYNIVRFLTKAGRSKRQSEGRRKANGKT